MHTQYTCSLRINICQKVNYFIRNIIMSLSQGTSQSREAAIDFSESTFEILVKHN